AAERDGLRRWPFLIHGDDACVVQHQIGARSRSAGTNQQNRGAERISRHGCTECRGREGVIKQNAAPNGSATTAIRPYGVSNAGTLCLPPSAMTCASEASTSATAKYVFHSEGISGGNCSVICISPNLTADPFCRVKYSAPGASIRRASSPNTRV